MAYGVSILIDAHRATGWPVAEGVVVGSPVGIHRRGDEESYEPVVRYRYPVGGTSYESDVYRIGEPAGEEGAARSVVLAYPVGKTVPVHCRNRLLVKP